MAKGRAVSMVLDPTERRELAAVTRKHGAAAGDCRAGAHRAGDEWSQEQRDSGQSQCLRAHRRHLAQPLLPMRPGKIERRTHDYKRHGTTTLFAALGVKAGMIVGTCMRRHRAREFRRFQGVFRSVRELEQAIDDYTEAANADPKPFRRTKTADNILASIQRFCLRTLDANG